MRFINPSVHGVLDYVIVVALVLVSIAVGLSGLAAAIAYLMAAALLVMITAFPLGALKLLPLPAHSRIELFIGMSLLVCPWIFGFADDLMAMNVFVVSGFALLVLRLFSKLD